MPLLTKVSNHRDVTQDADAAISQRTQEAREALAEIESEKEVGEVQFPYLEDLLGHCCIV